MESNTKYYNDIIREIRDLSVGEAQCSDTVRNILLQQNGWFLLSRVKHLPVALRAVFLANQLYEKKTYAECAQLFKDLCHIGYAVIKGAVLSNQIYGRPGFRPSQDIDILTLPENYGEIKKILMQNGFAQGKIANGKFIPYAREEEIYYRTFTHQVAPFVRLTDAGITEAINIDVNLSVMWGESDQKMDMTEFIAHTTTMTLYGMEVKKLMPEYEFISLCLHHYKDMNSIYLLAKKGLSLSLFCDLYFYIQNVAMDTRRLKEIATRRHVDEYLYYCIYYTHELFQDDRSGEMLADFNESKNEMLIDSFGLNDAERRRWNEPFFDRLLDASFSRRFVENLGAKDMDKLRANLKYL